MRNKVKSVANELKKHANDQQLFDFAYMFLKLYEDTGTIEFAIQSCEIVESMAEEQNSEA